VKCVKKELVQVNESIGVIMTELDDDDPEPVLRGQTVEQLKKLMDERCTLIDQCRRCKLCSH
jgi:shikimate kinase